MRENKHEHNKSNDVETGSSKDDEIEKWDGLIVHLVHVFLLDLVPFLFRSHH